MNYKMNNELTFEIMIHLRLQNNIHHNPNLFGLLSMVMDLKPDSLNQDKTWFQTLKSIWISHFLTSPYYTNHNKEEMGERRNGGRKESKKEQLKKIWRCDFGFLELGIWF